MRQHPIAKTLMAVAVVALMVAASPIVCQVPVFRYALERWEPDAHEILILSDGEISADAKSLLAQLAPDPVSDSPVANLKVRVVDGSTPESQQLLANWKDLHPQARFPHIAVRSPDIKQQRPVIWSAKLSQDSLDLLVDSTARQQVAEELIDGTSAAWILLLSDDEEQNKRAEQTLRKRLAHNEQTLQLPQLDSEDLAEGFDANKLKLKFEVVTVRRNDPEEQFLVESLLNVEGDLKDDEYASQPMAFPVFGRGRALYALIGNGIANDTIDEACRFLIGPCSCQVKDQNPGVDLLMAVDWNALVETSINSDVALPPLMGLSRFGKSKPKSKEAVESEPAGVVVERKDSEEVAAESADTSEGAAGTKAVAPAPSPKQFTGGIRWAVMLVAGIGLLGIFALVFMITRQS